MNLITWVVALCNKRWQREFDIIAEEIRANFTESELPKNTDREHILKIIDSQPTHLYYKNRPQQRKQRKHSNNKSRAAAAKEEALAKIMEEELMKLTY